MFLYTHEYFMQHALKQAQLAFEADEVPIGAIVVIHNKIIAKAYNQVELLNDSTAHAEILAITAACNSLGSKYLTTASLYVTIEPCLMCCGAMHWSKIARIIYGAADEKNGFRKYICSSAHSEDQILLPFHPKTELISGILAAECAVLLKDFFKAKR